MSEHRRPDNAAAARPAGKRQLTGASTTSSAQLARKKATKNTDDEKLGGGVVAFFPEVGSELKKVIWPTAKQMGIYTVVVLIFLIIMTALVSGVDFLAGLGVEKVLAG